MSALNIKKGATSHSAYDLSDSHSEMIVSHTLAVIVENAGFGSVSAAPIARRVFDYLLMDQYPNPQDLAAVRVKFRDLRDDEIENYLRTEQPYDCAGSAKSEGLGIALLESIENDDPTALVGLPLIRTCHMLRAAGLDLLGIPA
mgnify:CR=1 FL=1